MTWSFADPFEEDGPKVETNPHISTIAVRDGAIRPNNNLLSAAARPVPKNFLLGVRRFFWKATEDEKTGRMMMVPVEGTEEVIPADVVLIAAGFLGSQKYVTDAFKVNINGRTNVETKPEAYETSVQRVFTAGDMHRGQSLVVWAIREGREAARAVDESLMGYTNL